MTLPNLSMNMNINLNKFPNFLIVGANKAGTTSIHYYCNQHPQICMSAIKEPMFFTAPKQNNQNKNNKNSLSNPKFVTSIEEYQNLFIGGENAIARGESSTAYLANPDIAIPRIKAVTPKMKIIACLRNPIDRAFSNYVMYYSEGIEKRTFEQSVSDEIEGRLQGIPQGRHYLRLGLYSEAVAKYFEAFGKENFLILLFDRLKEDPETFIKKIFEFLKVDESFIPALNVKINTSQQRIQQSQIERPEMSQKAHEMCFNFFADDIKKLKYLISFEDISWI